MSQKILITGISGFVGANLARGVVENGHEVHGIVRDESKNAWRLEEIKSKIKIHTGSIIDKEFIKKVISEVKPDVIYHLAVYGAYPTQKDPELTLESSVMATLYLLESAKENDVKMFVNTGSSSEYGTKDHPMREDEIVVPNSFYAVGKVAQTLLCSHFSKEKGLPTITLRLFSVYGAFEEPGRFVPTLILNTLENKDAPLASPDTARDFIYIDDVVRAFILAGERPDLSGEVFNIGSGKQETIKTAVDTCMRVTKSTSKLLWNSYPKRPFDTSIWVADSSKAEKLLGFKTEMSFENGLEKMITWMKDHKSYYQK
ncbi:MAG: NAD-dependent epimerase/dehydratase family protein [Minisyncoccia bacterium]